MVGSKEGTPNNAGEALAGDPLASVVGDIAASAPEPNEHAVLERTEQVSKDHASLTDRNGTPFDPELHMTDAAGNPLKTVQGFARMRPGRKGTSGGASPRSRVASPSGPGEAAAGKVKPDTAYQSGVGAANLLIAVGVTIGGDEWKPQTHTVDDGNGDKITISERANLESAFGDYFVATGISDIPPGWALMLACATYALPRLNSQTTKSRVSNAWTWVRGKWAQRADAQIED